MTTLEQHAIALAEATSSSVADWLAQLEAARRAGQPHLLTPLGRIHLPRQADPPPPKKAPAKKKKAPAKRKKS